MEPGREKLAVASTEDHGDAHRRVTQPLPRRPPGNGYLLIRLLGQVLRSTALTVRLALLILVLAVALLISSKAIPWAQLGHLFPALPQR